MGSVGWFNFSYFMFPWCGCSRAVLPWHHWGSAGSSSCPHTNSQTGPLGFYSLSLVPALVGSSSCSKVPFAFELELVIAERFQKENWLLQPLLEKIFGIVQPELEEGTISVPEAHILKEGVGKQLYQQ